MAQTFEGISVAAFSIVAETNLSAQERSKQVTYNKTVLSQIVDQAFASMYLCRVVFWLKATILLFSTQIIHKNIYSYKLFDRLIHQEKTSQTTGNKKCQIKG